MDLDDKLKQLRREREARNRSQKIQDTWERLDAEAGLSVKDKLERLISLTDTGWKGRGAKSEPKTKPDADKRRSSVEFRENPYLLGARYGQIPISLGLGI